MSTINAGNAALSSAVIPELNSASKVKTSGVSDAEAVAKVIATVIKPSNIDATSQPTRDVVAKAAAELQNFVQSMGRNLSFSVDETTGYHVVRVVNPNTGELVRQLPSEELLKISRDFQRLNNALVSQTA
jgi:flagellar protein FlaG